MSQEGCSLPATSRAPVTPHSLCPHHGQASVQEQKPNVKHQAPAALHLATLLLPWYLPAQIPFYLAQPGRAAGQEPSKADSRWVATALCRQHSAGAAAPVPCSTTAASAWSSLRDNTQLYTNINGIFLSSPICKTEIQKSVKSLGKSLLWKKSSPT